jgi:hypothetical protein
MSRLSLRALFLAAALIALISQGCGGSDSDDTVRVEWQPKDQAKLQTSLDASAIQTVIYVTNPTDRTLREVRLRLPPLDAGVPGLSMGTVAGSRTHFEGETYVWSLGDMAPHSRVAFDLGLWFESSLKLQGEITLGLAVELVSQDLEESISSNQLSIVARSN